MLQSIVQQFAAHGTVGYTQRKPHRATLSGELKAVRLIKRKISKYGRDSKHSSWIRDGRGF
jgi:hypothetical protein